jgi:hypothetical protein
MSFTVTPASGGSRKRRNVRRRKYKGGESTMSQLQSALQAVQAGGRRRSVRRRKYKGGTKVGGESAMGAITSALNGLKTAGAPMSGGRKTRRRSRRAKRTRSRKQHGGIFGMP